LKKLLIFLVFFTILFAGDTNLELLQKDKKEYRNLDKKSIEERYKYLKYDWLSPINTELGITRKHSFSDEKIDKQDRYSKSASIGFTQSIFESGGIEFKIDYAENRFKYELMSWENQNYQLLYSLYDTLLEIKKIKLELEQNDFQVLNKEIELIIKKIQYDAGKSDIIELNNAVMSKNLIIKENINIENSLKEKEMELKKYTDLNFDDIEILDFKPINKKDFLDKNFDILQEDLKVDMLNSSYKINKSSYLPKVTISTRATHANSDDSFNKMVKDTNKDDSSASVGLNLSMPLYDFNKKAKLQESKIEVLKQKALVNDLKNETAYDFEQSLSQIDRFEKFINTIKENIKLYDELIVANKISNQAGMTAKYDLEILENTRSINVYDVLINEIKILQEYSRLYFKIRG